MRNKFYTSLQIMLYVFILCSCAQMISCKSNGEEKPASLKIMNWNLQTFFDASFDGNEYSEFATPKSGWNEEKYKKRLERLTEVVKTLDADILIFEELEKEEQLYDISNRLSGSFNFAKLYTSGFFASNEGSSIGCAILSRIPLGNAEIHNISFRSDSAVEPSMRPIIKIEAYKENKPLILFVNHWKSKSGDEKASRIWREKQEKLLSRLILKQKGMPVIAVGDFNMDISEFKYTGDSKENIALRGKNTVSVYSPWIKNNGKFLEGGSYFYKDNWEKIDHFFSCGPAAISEFCAEKKGSWADSDGHPLRYTIWNGNGYSDHLPVTCTVTF